MKYLKIVKRQEAMGMRWSPEMKRGVLLATYNERLNVIFIISIV